MIPEILLGPPGCGKTHSLLDFVDSEIQSGTPPDRIAFVSFTRRAIEEAVSRACQKFSLTPKQLPWFRTLHSLCFRALGLTSRDVCEGARMREFADLARIQYTGRRSEDGTLAGYAPGDRALHLEHLARVRCVPLRRQYDESAEALPWREVERVAAALSLFKADRGLLDFTDMLSEMARSPSSTPRLDVLVVDECADLSALQWQVVWLLAAGVRRMVVAGDDDQCIYRWAGADVEAFVDLAGQSRVLGQSYRVPRAVQRLAGEIVAGVARRRAKAWSPRSAEGSIHRAHAPDEADWSGEWGGTMQPVLVLARNVYVLRDQVAPALRRAGVLHEWGDRPALARETAEAIVAWEHLRAGGTTDGATARRIYALMTGGRGYAQGHRELAGVGDEDLVTLELLAERHGLLTRGLWREALDRLSADDVALVVAARQRGEHLLGRPRVRLSTIHAAKGGEARHVVLMREMAPRTYEEMLHSLAGEEDERRCWYVGVTRAMERLTVVESKRREACPWV